MVWGGSAASAVSLHPAGVRESSARAVAAGQQGGWVVYPDGATFATLWSGTAQSMTSLNPGAGYVSAIEGMAPGQQVGNAQASGQNPHAALWTGSAGSFVDMNPPGAALSFLYGTCGSAQVGYANMPGLGNTAGIWFGTAESFVPLAPFLPPGYYQSRATCIAEANGVFYVGGYATTSVNAHYEAFMWVGVPAPGPVAVLLLAAPYAARRRRGTLHRG